MGASLTGDARRFCLVGEAVFNVQESFLVKSECTGLFRPAQ
jgi:hypothetical protein